MLGHHVFGTDFVIDNYFLFILHYLVSLKNLNSPILLFFYKKYKCLCQKRKQLTTQEGRQKDLRKRSQIVHMLRFKLISHFLIKLHKLYLCVLFTAHCIIFLLSRQYHRTPFTHIHTNRQVGTSACFWTLEGIREPQKKRTSKNIPNHTNSNPRAG